MTRGHLRWSEILEALEKGQRPPHIESCSPCRRRWEKAAEGLKGLAPETPEMDVRADLLMQRILLTTERRRPRRLPRVQVRWAAVIALGTLCVVGPLALWHALESNKERLYESLMTESWSPSMAGLGGLIPVGPVDPLEETMDSLDAILPWSSEALLEPLSLPSHEGEEMINGRKYHERRRNRA